MSIRIGDSSRLMDPVLSWLALVISLGRVDVLQLKNRTVLGGLYDAGYWEPRESVCRINQSVSQPASQPASQPVHLDIPVKVWLDTGFWIRRSVAQGPHSPMFCGIGL